MAKKIGLGKGLDFLLSSSNIKPPVHAQPVTVQHLTKHNQSVAHSFAQGEDHAFKQLPIEQIKKGKYQPRTHIEPDALQALADSIKSQGLMQPIVVRPIPHDGAIRYELIAGERRWRASQLAELHDIPAIVRDIPDQAAAAMALIENIQREDLNPLEEASALSHLVQEFGLTHQQTADAVGRSRSVVSNLLRLLDLDDSVKRLVEQHELEMGHARALLALSQHQQFTTAQHIIDKRLSVRETEKLVKKLLNPEQTTEKRQAKCLATPEIRQLESTLQDRLGANVKIQHQPKGKGKLLIEYNSLDELDGILAHIQ
ncbi:MAG: ParB/RepB/Spo0J family partition protein [bacterium]